MTDYYPYGVDDDEREEGDWDLTVELTEDGGERRVWGSDPNVPSVFGEHYESYDDDSEDDLDNDVSAFGSSAINSQSTVPRDLSPGDTKYVHRSITETTTCSGSSNSDTESPIVAYQAYLKLEVYTARGVLLGMDQLPLGRAVDGLLSVEEFDLLDRAIQTSYDAFRAAMPMRGQLKQYGYWMVEHPGEAFSYSSTTKDFDTTPATTSEDDLSWLDVPF